MLDRALTCTGSNHKDSVYLIPLHVYCTLSNKGANWTLFIALIKVPLNHSNYFGRHIFNRKNSTPCFVDTDVPGRSQSDTGQLSSHLRSELVSVETPKHQVGCPRVLLDQESSNCMWM